MYESTVPMQLIKKQLSIFNIGDNVYTSNLCRKFNVLPLQKKRTLSGIIEFFFAFCESMNLSKIHDHIFFETVITITRKVFSQ